MHSFLSVYYFAAGSGAKYSDQRVCTSVCLFVCLFVCPFSYLETTRPDFMKILYMLPVAAARLYSDNNAIRYVLPVLWMTSRFYIMKSTGQNQKRRVCFVEIVRWQHQGRSCCIRLHACLFIHVSIYLLTV